MAGTHGLQLIRIDHAESICVMPTKGDNVLKNDSVQKNQRPVTSLSSQGTLVKWSLASRRDPEVLPQSHKRQNSDTHSACMACRLQCCSDFSQKYSTASSCSA